MLLSEELYSVSMIIGAKFQLLYLMPILDMFRTKEVFFKFELKIKSDSTVMSRKVVLFHLAVKQQVPNRMESQKQW